MANPPPPYNNITGISRTVMKDNAQESITNYNGNARPGEIVVNLTTNDVYIGNTNGNLNLLVIGGGSGNSEPAGPVGAIQYNSGGNLFGGTANVTVSGTGISVAGNVTGGNIVSNTVVSNGSGNVAFTGNLVPTANTYTLGTESDPWQSAYFGPESITLLDTTDNTDNTVIIENVAGNITMSTAGFDIQTLGTTDSIFRIEAITGQIYSNANTIIQNATDAANTTSGSLQTAGGAGIAKNLYVGANANIAGNLAVTGNVSTNTVFGGNLQATSSAGGKLTNSSGTTQLSWGAGGGNNLSISVPTNFSANVTSNLSVTGNITGGNILTAGLISATGNVTAPYFLGNGSQLTGIVSSYSNANVVTLLAGFGSNVISTTGNITGGNLTISGISNLSSNANVKITGGTAGQALTTDGTGNLRWTDVASGNTTPTYGQFWSNVTQTVSSANTEYQFTFNNTDGHNNVQLGSGVSNSRVIINKTGLYNIQFSAQIDKASGSGTSSSAYIWFKKNGTAIGDSAGFFTLDNAIQTVETWNILANVTTAGDYYEIAYAASATNFSFPTIAGNAVIGYPASPSIIITVTPIGT